MDKSSKDKPEINERRTFLRAGGLGALALLMNSLQTSEGEAADVKYNKKDLARVNKKLKTSARERKAFYANPQKYLRKNGIRVSNDMIPSRNEVQNALKAKSGKVASALGGEGEGNSFGRAMASVIVFGAVGGSAAKMKTMPAKKMQGKKIK